MGKLEVRNAQMSVPTVWDKCYAQGSQYFLSSKVESVLGDMATHSNKRVRDVKCCLLVHCLEATSFLCRETHIHSSVSLPYLHKACTGSRS